MSDKAWVKQKIHFNGFITGHTDNVLFYLLLRCSCVRSAYCFTSFMNVKLCADEVHMHDRRLLLDLLQELLRLLLNENRQSITNASKNFYYYRTLALRQG